MIDDSRFRGMIAEEQTHPCRAHKRRARAAAKQAATLTPLEAQALSQLDGGKSPAQIAQILGMAEGAVMRALKVGASKQDAPRYAADREYLRDVAAAARNYRTEECLAVEVTGSEVREAVPVLRWQRWPFRDHAAVQNQSA